MLTKIKFILASDLKELLSKAWPEGNFTVPTVGELADALETPKQISNGQLALPVFVWAKTLRIGPPQITSHLAKLWETQGLPPHVKKVVAAGGYLNIFLTEAFSQNFLLTETRPDVANVGFSTKGAGRRVILDYSSPNVAKRMSIGHLRSTVIGRALRNLALSQGYEVVGLNYLGDWGVQFGKLAWAIDQWGGPDWMTDPRADGRSALEYLQELYVRFHDEVEKDASLEARGAEYFKRLEGGDAHVAMLWTKILDISMTEYQKMYTRLGVSFDKFLGESFFNDKMEAAIQRIETAGLLQTSEGAEVVFLEEDMPPCLIRKSDGTSLYATRDITSAIYRAEDLKGDLLLYVVGVDQTLHFNQVFAVLTKMGFGWAKNCHHISFGMYRFKDLGKMSTRKGRVVLMQDVIDRSVELVKERMVEKNPELPNIDKLAEQVGIGAVIFNDLVNDRVKNIDFDWERAVSFDGDSGPYVQYAHVRCLSILRKAGSRPGSTFKTDLASLEEQALVRELLRYEEVLTMAFDNFKPSQLAQYLLDVCSAFNQFYQKHRILGEPAEVEESRLVLVRSTARVLAAGLAVLGIPAPEQM
jgi:arginyl-tRNA synthetase